MGPAPTALLLLLATALAAGSAPDAPEAGEASDARVERFVLEESDGSLAGTAVWRRSTGRRGVQLERELEFYDPSRAGEPLGISQAECLEDPRPRAVFRERGAGGRAVLLEWSGQNRSGGGRSAEGESEARAELTAIEWSRCGTRREQLACERSTLMPLALCELVREGRLAAGQIDLFDPLAFALETFELRTLHARPAAGGVDRTVELVRADGTLALRLEFAGTVLEAFTLQSGGPRARRVGPEEHERARARAAGG